MSEEQKERRAYLIRALLSENRNYDGLGIPADEGGQRRLLRALMNVRSAAPVSGAFERVQDAYLQEELRRKGVVGIGDMEETLPGIYLWQGDITRIAADAVVNAANSGMTGCYYPNHTCIDNCIHTFAGIQLRNACEAMMQAQGCEEAPGGAKVTGAYNLPAKYVIHTVGPQVNGSLTEEDEQTLVSCYRACLEKCREYGMRSIAFCCISTGVFGFPKKRAAELAVQTVRNYLQTASEPPAVIFNVYTDEDLAIYRELLKG